METCQAAGNYRAGAVSFFGKKGNAYPISHVNEQVIKWLSDGKGLDGTAGWRGMSSGLFRFGS